MKYRIRKKKEKHVVQKFNGVKWISRTLDPEKLWYLLGVSSNVSSNVSSPTHKELEKEEHSFAQSSLNEPSEDEIKRTLKEINKLTD